MTKELERARVWILIRADDPEVKAQRIYDVLGYKEPEETQQVEEREEDQDSFLLVRADVVDYYYNIVIPVDAANLDIVQQKLCEIQTLAEAKEIVVVPVTMHFPDPPHEADGYITPEEADRYNDEGEVIVGRQRNSPGVNPWG